MKVHFQQVESWMVQMVGRRLSDFDYRGKLDRQHYSFCKTAVLSPFPVYQHLLFCYNRSDRKLQVRVGASLLSHWQLKRNPGRISRLSDMIACDLSGHARFLDSRRDFEQRLIELLQEFLPRETEALASDGLLLEGLECTMAGRSLRKDRFSSKLRSDLRLVLKQRGLLESAHPEGSKEQVDEMSSQMRAFLADLNPENSAVDEGAFTLNAAKAADKLQKFQLSTPQNFVVHVVGAAVMGGAGEVRVHVDSDDIEVTFDGSPMDEDEMSGILDSMFDAHSSKRSRELGVALNAAVSLQPRFVLLQSWNGERGLSRNLIDGSKPEPLSECPFQLNGTNGHRVWFRDRPSLKVARRFVNSLEHSHPEVDLLRQRCAMSPVPVLYKGEDLRCRPEQTAAAYLCWEHPQHSLGDLHLPVDAGERRESPGDFSLLLLVGPKPGLQISVGGVLYSPPQETEWPCWGLLVDHQLNRDLSYVGIREDARWTGHQTHLQQARLQLREIALKRLSHSAGEHRLALASFLRLCFHDGFVEAGEHPIFETVDGGLLNLKAINSMESIGYTRKRWKHPLRSGDPVLVLDQKDHDFLTASTSLVLRDTQLKSSQTYFERRERWLALPQSDSIRLERGFGRVRSIKGLKGELGLNRGLGPAQLSLYDDGRPLPPAAIKPLPQGLRIAVEFSGLEVDDEWTSVVKGKALNNLVSSLESALPEFYGSLFGDTKYTNHLLSYLIYLKNNGKSWQGLLDRVSFRLLDGSSIDWMQLARARQPLHQIRGHWLRRFHLSRKTKALLGELLR